MENAGQVGDVERTPGSGAQAPGAVAAPRTIDFDIPCQKCAYNLRGLAGDPVRCPECGEMNLLGDAAAEIPESVVADRLRGMEISLVTCVGAVLVAIPMQILFWWTFVDALSTGFRSGGVEEALLCVGTGAFAPLLIWCVAVFAFRVSCGRKPGWGRLLLRYHLYGVGVGGVLLGAMIAIPATWWPTGRGMRLPNFVVPAIVFIGAIVVVRRWLVAPYQRLMADIHGLQREVAISKIRAAARARTERWLRF